MNGISVQKTKTGISNELVACVGSIDDWSFMAILDTGANANYISVIFAMKLKTMVEYERRPSITTSSDTEMESYGVIWNVKIKVYGHECIQNFVIVKSPHSVILGTPWLDRMSAKLCFNTDCDRKLMIGQKEHDLVNYTMAWLARHGLRGSGPAFLAYVFRAATHTVHNCFGAYLSCFVMDKRISVCR